MILIMMEDGHKVVLANDDLADAILKKWDGGKGSGVITIDGKDLESPPGRPYKEHIAAHRIIRIIVEDKSAGHSVGFA